MVSPFDTGYESGVAGLEGWGLAEMESVKGGMKRIVKNSVKNHVVKRE